MLSPWIVLIRKLPGAPGSMLDPNDLFPPFLQAGEDCRGSTGTFRSLSKAVSNKKSLIPVQTGIQGLHPAQLDPFLVREMPRPPKQRFVREPLWNSGRFSGSRISLIAIPSQPVHPNQWIAMAFVPVYSGGTATVSHRLPF